MGDDEREEEARNRGHGCVEGDHRPPPLFSYPQIYLICLSFGPSRHLDAPPLCFPLQPQNGLVSSPSNLD